MSACDLSRTCRATRALRLHGLPALRGPTRDTPTDRGGQTTHAARRALPDRSGRPVRLDQRVPDRAAALARHRPGHRRAAPGGARGRRGRRRRRGPPRRVTAPGQRTRDGPHRDHGRPHPPVRLAPHLCHHRPGRPRPSGPRGSSGGPFGARRQSGGRARHAGRHRRHPRPRPRPSAHRPRRHAAQPRCTSMSPGPRRIRSTAGQARRAYAPANRFSKRSPPLRRRTASPVGRRSSAGGEAAPGGDLARATHPG